MNAICSALLKTHGYRRCARNAWRKFYGTQRGYMGDYWLCGHHARIARKAGRIHVTGHGATTLILITVEEAPV